MLTIKMEGSSSNSPTPPTNYFFSYEYSQITEEIKKLNEKMDTILSLSQKRKRSTIAEVNTKMDNLLEHMEKKKKL